MIHPTAIVHPRAQIHPLVEVGPYCVIDEHVTLGEGSLLEAGARVTGHTVIGRGNRFHTGCVVGDAPQDLRYKGEPTRLRVGNDNVFREHVTIHRSNRADEDTVIGSNNYFMAGSHVGHNCAVGNHVILANGAMLGGHATVGDRAFISGNCLVHQFVRVGPLAIMQGGSAASQDVPPFTIATGDNHICGLNIVGLRRAGFTLEDRMALKRLYHALFFSGGNLREAAAQAREQFANPHCLALVDFVLASRRGVCRHGRSSSRRQAEKQTADD